MFLVLLVVWFVPKGDCGLGNRTNEITDIKEGQPCKRNKLYRMDCNTCVCGENNALICSKMACLSSNDMIMLEGYRHMNKIRTLNTNDSYRDNFKTGKCTPGEIIRRGCFKCFCDKLRTLSCSEKNLCTTPEKGLSKDTPEDVGLKYTPEESDKLDILPTYASRCEPGFSYKVDCNVCLCTVHRILLCSKLLCLSTQDMNKFEAQKRSGIPCNDSGIEETTCVKCNCENYTTVCKPVADCFPHPERKLNSDAPKKTLEYVLNDDKSRECYPGSVYRRECNKCYCQRDGKLFCTLKTCLNHLQELKFKKYYVALRNKGQ
ncbi:hypothetical protein ACJJTC_017531 [Scirpophaga incertulas]